MSSYYNPRSGNPFAKNDPNPEWTSNELILQDANLRAKSGVYVLDADVANVFNGQKGGGAVGAPFHIQSFGTSTAKPYPDVPVMHELVPTPEKPQLGGMPSHYYNNDKKW
jgi:hypothetical protein